MRKIFIIVFFIYILMIGCNESKTKKETNCKCKEDEVGFENKGVKQIYGIFFKNGKPIYFDPGKLPFSEFFWTYKLKGNNNREIIDYFWGGYMHEIDCKVYYYEYDERMDFRFSTEKEYNYQICNEKLWLKEKGTNEWEPVEILYVKKFLANDADECYRACMLIKIKTKWFTKEFVIACDPNSFEELKRYKIGEEIRP